MERGMLGFALVSVKHALLPPGPRFRRIALGPAAGCVMSIDLHHHLRHFLGLYEFELIPHLKALIKPGYKCFYVGGQGGYDALIMANTSRAPVVSFECDAKAAEVMRETFGRNPAFEIQVAEVFVGDINDGRHMTIDEAACEFFVPDFIKIDIEGSEDEALRGAASVLSRRGPGLIIETHAVDKEEFCLGLLRSHGYSPLIVDRRRWFGEHRPLAHNRWIVCRGADRVP